MALNKRFRRSLPNKHYKRLIIISTEGTKTEREYFAIFRSPQFCIKLTQRCFRTSPDDVLKRMEERLGEEELQPQDEAWIVVDRDNWPEKQLEALYKWSKKKENYGMAVSNPAFEFWLLLHFEDGKKIKSLKNLRERLKNICLIITRE